MRGSTWRSVTGGGGGAGQQGGGPGRGARRAVGLEQPMPAPRGPEMLAQKAPGLRVHEPDVEVIPLDRNPTADPARRRAVVGVLDLDTAIEVDRALAVAIVPKGFEWERAQGRLLVGKHRHDLPFRGAVDARVRP